MRLPLFAETCWMSKSNSDNHKAIRLILEFNPLYFLQKINDLASVSIVNRTLVR